METLQGSLHTLAVTRYPLLRIRCCCMSSNVLSPTQRETENQQWLEDAAIRMVCVFALDRFADFVSDQVRLSTNDKWHVHRCAGVVLYNFGPIQNVFEQTLIMIGLTLATPKR